MTAKKSNTFDIWHDSLIESIHETHKQCKLKIETYTIDELFDFEKLFGFQLHPDIKQYFLTVSKHTIVFRPDPEHSHYYKDCDLDRHSRTYFPSVEGDDYYKHWLPFFHLDNWSIWRSYNCYMNLVTGEIYYEGEGFKHHDISIFDNQSYYMIPMGITFVELMEKIHFGGLTLKKYVKMIKNRKKNSPTLYLRTLGTFCPNPNYKPR